MTSRAPERLAGLVLACAVSACGSGTLDPFEEFRQVAPQPPEECSQVDRDETKNFIPPELGNTITTLRATSAGPFTIDWARYPLPYTDAKVWATWSKGVIAANGRYYSAVGDGSSAGDDSGRDGNTFLYEYDPATGTLRAVGDVISAFGMHVPGENGYGKIQGQIGEGACGLLYMHSYWGSPSFVSYVGNYQGDLLLRFNPFTKRLENLGVKIPRMGVPSMTLWRGGGLIYAEANTPTDPKDVTFWAYDIARDTVIFQSPRRQRNDRNIAVDRSGRAYYTGLGSDLYVYDPATNSEAALGVAFAGGGWLRASTRAAADGTIVMVTTDPNEVYRFDPSVPALKLLATLTRPTSDIDLDPTERSAYFVPVGLDGGSAFDLYELNRMSGAMRVVLNLADAIEAASGSRPLGSYSINLSADGRSIYIAANSGQPDGFGVPLLIVVHLPDAAL